MLSQSDRDTEYNEEYAYHLYRRGFNDEILFCFVNFMRIDQVLDEI